MAGNEFYSRIIRKVWTFCIVLFLCASHAGAQFLQRQGLGSSGGEGLVDGIRFHQTVGQPYVTTGFYNEEFSLHPGFQQCSFFNSVIADPLPKIQLTLYPNPASDFFVVECSDSIDNVTLQVFDISGKIILTEETGKFKSWSVRSEGWLSGFYTISVTDKMNNKYSAKLVISK